MARESPQEEQTPAGVQWAGLVLGPVLAGLILLFVPADGASQAGALTPGGRAVMAVAALMAAWWLTEALPLAVTSLLPLVLLPLLRVTTFKGAAAPYADELIFLFGGGFVIGLALEASGLHRRLAVLTLMGVGTRPAMMVGGVMGATAFISMWVSNTATAVMMLPIALSVVALMEERAGPAATAHEAQARRNFGTAMLLGMAYACSVGGIGTKIGTPPNGIMAGVVSEKLGLQIGFGQWMIVAVPVVLVLLLIFWVLLVGVLHPVRGVRVEGGRAFLRGQWSELGPMRRAEWIVLTVFVAASALWVAHRPLSDWLGFYEVHARGKRDYWVTDAVIAVAAAISLFLIPVSARGRTFVLTWRQAERLPWGVLLLFGGGLSVAAAMGATGLDAFLGQQFKSLGGAAPLPVLLLICAGLVFFGELASNTAVAATFMPVLLAAAPAMGMDPLVLLFPATFAASCGFMLPVATPPNAIAFATGRIGMGRMVRTGAVLDAVSVVVIVATMYWLGPTLLRMAGLAATAAP